MQSEHLARLRSALADRYHIEREIGRGGMSTVYLAEDLKHGRPVAIKVLKPELATAVGPDRFLREIEIAAKLSHPHILPLHDSGEAGGFLYHVTPFVEGESLREKLERERQLPLEEALLIARQVANALSYAHAHGFVHRDIKPENVLLQDGEAVVTDFGIARALTAAGGDTLTASGIVVGTPQYMSPEQGAGDRDLDARSDIYALGCVLYEMLAGEPPFTGRTARAVIARHVGERLPSLQAVRPDLPAWLEQIVHTALAKAPADRFSTAESFSQALAGQTRPRGRRRGLSARGWRRRIGLGVAVVVLLAGFLVLQTRARDPGTLPEQKHLAVIPFATLSEDSATYALADGLVENITTMLTQLEQFQGALWVVPNAEVRRQGIESPSEAKDAFATNLALTGSVQARPDSVRVTLNLVDTDSLRQLRSAVISEGRADMSRLQTAIVSELARMLELTLRPQAQQLIVMSRTAVPRAYDFYLQAQGYLQRYEEEANVDHAVSLFRRALQLDPDYALAHAGLAEAYRRKFETARNSHWVDSARVHSQHALEINDNLAPVRVSLGLLYSATGESQEAVREFLKALQLDPHNSAAYRGLADAYHALGDLEEAESTYLKAIELKPGYWVGYNDLGVFYFRTGRYQEAAAQFERVIELTPDNARGYANLGGAYQLMERYDTAAALYQRSVDIREEAHALSNLGSLYFWLGRYRDAARTLERAVELDDRQFEVWHNLASAYHWLPGEEDKARAAYETAARLARRALLINPNDPEALSKLADAYAMLDRRDEAIAYAERVVAVSPQDPEMMFRVADIYEELGERDLALKYIGRALELGYPTEELRNLPGLKELLADPRFDELEHR